MVKEAANSHQKVLKRGIIFTLFVSLLTVFLIFLLFGSRDLGEQKSVKTTTNARP